MKVDIRKLGHSEKVPMDLLLLADPSVDMIEKYIFSSECYLVELDGEPVGAFVLHANTTEEIELKNIAVIQSHQRTGIGKEVIKYVVRISKMEGYTSLIAKTADVSLGVQEFYKKLKFEEFYIVKGHFIQYYNQPIIDDGETAEDQIVFKRDL